MMQHKNTIFVFCFFLFLFSLFLFFQAIIGPIILSALVAYLFNPLLLFFESKKIERSVSTFVVVTLLMLVLTIVLWIVTPILYSQISTLSHMLPEFKSYLETMLFPKMMRIASEITGQHFKTNVHFSDVLTGKTTNIFENLLARIESSTKFVLSTIFAFFITPILLYFIMRDFGKICEQILNLVPLSIKPSFLKIIKEVDRKLKSVILGQLLVISILCCLYSTALFIAGLPTAIAAGFMIGISRIVPYMDTFLGSFLCFFLLVVNRADNNLIIAVVTAFLFVQALDSLVITPRIMGKFSGIHPFLVILSVICFGFWFGFYGVLLAVPIAAVGKVLVRILLRKYKNSSFFSNIKELS